MAHISVCICLFVWGTLQTRQFKSLMCGNHSSASILKFWDHLKTLPGFQHHDLLQSLGRDELLKAIPLCIHGDGAEMYRDDEFRVLNWSSAFASSAGHDCLLTRYPILLLAERQMQCEEDLWQY